MDKPRKNALRFPTLPTGRRLPTSFTGGHVINQKISSYAMKPSAPSIDETVRPSGPVEVHRFFESD
jgi:hypothetical protein